jgi:hypothetical protein
VRAAVWRRHLRGESFSAISRALDLNARSVSRIVRACYQELGRDRKAVLAAALDESIERLRAVQRQAWSDHDEDDQRERAALASALDGRGDEKGGRKGKGARPARSARGDGARFTSQRAQYLRVALDAEREIARLRGLYGAVIPEMDATVVFRIERVEPASAAGVDAVDAVDAAPIAPGLPAPDETVRGGA